MRVVFWGTRGSLPAPIDAAGVRAKVIEALVKGAGRGLNTPEKAAVFVDAELSFAEAGTFGGNSSCVEVDTGGPERLLCDLGSGARVFGGAMMRRFGPGKPQTYHVLMSHLHWDHIMGFPFFTPAYIPGNRIAIYGCHDDVEGTFRRQNAAPNFPVPFEALGAKVEFVRLTPEQPTPVADCTVTAKLQLHGGDSYGYRIEHSGKTVVYSTDSEHKPEDNDHFASFAAFFRNADIIVFDAMYSLADAMSVKEDWGHSSNVTGVELAQAAGAKHLVLFHHEPIFDDSRLETILAETRRFEEITRRADKLRVTTAYDGLVIEL